jgi:hypothetical protein
LAQKNYYEALLLLQYNGRGGAWCYYGKRSETFYRSKPTVCTILYIYIHGVYTAVFIIIIVIIFIIIFVSFIFREPVKKKGMNRMFNSVVNYEIITAYKILVRRKNEIIITRQIS